MTIVSRTSRDLASEEKAQALADTLCKHGEIDTRTAYLVLRLARNVARFEGAHEVGDVLQDTIEALVEAVEADRIEEWERS